MRYTGIMIFFLSLPASLLAGISPGQTKGDAGAAGYWLSNYSASARSLAMGMTGAALTGAEAAYFNPAGIAGLEAAEASVLFSPLLEDGQFQTLSVAYPFSNRSRGVGLSIYHLSSGDAEQTNSLGETVGTFKDQNLAGVITYGRRFWRDWLSVGTSLKYVQQSLAGNSGNGFGMDAGLQARFFEKKLQVGLSYMNLLPPSITLKEKEESYPALIRSGVSSQWDFFSSEVIFTADVALSEDAGGNKTQRVAFGMEVEPLQGSSFPILLRAGLNQQSVTMGLALMKNPVSLEYAASFHELDLIHQFGVKLKFGLLSPMAEAKLRSEWLSLAEREEAIKKKLAEKEKHLRRLKRELKNSRSLTAAPPKPEKKDDEIQTISAQSHEAEFYYHQKDYQKAKEIVQRGRIPGVKPDNRLLALESLIDARLLIQQDMLNKAQEKLFEAVQYDPLNDEAAEVYRKVREIIDINRELEKTNE